MEFAKRVKGHVKVGTKSVLLWCKECVVNFTGENRIAPLNNNDREWVSHEAIWACIKSGRSHSLHEPRETWLAHLGIQCIWGQHFTKKLE